MFSIILNNKPKENYLNYLCPIFFNDNILYKILLTVNLLLKLYEQYSCRVDLKIASKYMDVIFFFGKLLLRLDTFYLNITLIRCLEKKRIAIIF